MQWNIEWKEGGRVHQGLNNRTLFSRIIIKNL